VAGQGCFDACEEGQEGQEEVEEEVILLRRSCGLFCRPLRAEWIGAGCSSLERRIHFWTVFRGLAREHFCNAT
jgi:hypothetical protein